SCTTVLHCLSLDPTLPTPLPLLTLHDALPISLRLQNGQGPIERRQRRTDLHVRLQTVVERVGCLEPVAGDADDDRLISRDDAGRSEEHTSESSHGSISYAVFCLKKKIDTPDTK